MAFASEIHLLRLEVSIAAYRRALAQPLIVPLRIVATDVSGISTMELLQKDLPFGSPSFCKTKIFDHPNVLSATFVTRPTPHFILVGTIDGVLSAMRRRYSYFIQQNAIALFKQESADSLIFRPPRPSQPTDGQLYSTMTDIPDLEPIPTDIPDLEPIPTMSAIPSTTFTPLTRHDKILMTIHTHMWDSDFEYDPTIDRLQPSTPLPQTSTDDDPYNTLPYIPEDTESDDDPDDLGDPTDPAPSTPPLPPAPPASAPDTHGPSKPTCPPDLSPPGNQTFAKLKLKILNFFNK
jgi:hypothetical protein